MPYQPYYPDGWEDLPSVDTPVTAAALANFDDGIEAAFEAIDAIPAGPPGPTGPAGPTGPPGDPTTVADGAIGQAKVNAIAGWITDALGSKAAAADLDNVYGIATGAIQKNTPLPAATGVWGAASIVDDGSNTNSWPNRFTVTFQPVTGPDVLTYWINEYGEARATPAKPNTVGHRIFAATDATALAARDAAVPVFEVSSKRNPTAERVTVFGIVKDGGIIIGPEAGTRLRHGTVLTLTAGQTAANVPATEPAGTLILRRKS